MNRLKNSFKTLKQNNDTALVGFVTAGDPDIETSLKIITAMCESGIDILELGVPFSDPSADGPVIQRSSSRALKHDVSLKTVMDMIRKIRKITSIPIIIFSYYNPIMAYGIENFQPDAIAAGADGVLLVDLPMEESDELTSCWKKNDFSLINLVAPTTPKERMAKIASASSGFLYLVSKTGLTGSNGLDIQDISEKLTTLRSVTELPICVGFGISSPANVADIASVADGVVIGSAFEKIIEENIHSRELPSMLSNAAQSLKAATRY